MYNDIMYICAKGIIIGGLTALKTRVLAEVFNRFMMNDLWEFRPRGTRFLPHI